MPTGLPPLSSLKFSSGRRTSTGLPSRSSNFVLMLRPERLHAIKREEQLNGQRLLTPERAVIVEGRDAFGDRDEIRRAFLRDLGDKGDDGLLRCSVIPRGERVLGLGGGEAGEGNR